MNREKVLSFHARIVKDINERLVLKLIQEHQIISSSELVKLTGMRPSTIFNILKELSAKNFVQMHGKGESTNKGGKKPFTWMLNSEAAYVIGIDIEVGEMTWVLMNFSGGIVAKKITKMETGHTVDELAESIINVVSQVIIENNVDSEKILGLGVAFSGIVDHEQGVVVMSSVVSEMHVSLQERLSSLPFPVMIENNANAAAIGLKRNGNETPRRNYMTVLVEIDKNVSGLGIGIVIDGEIYRGSSFCAGELYPHLPTLKDILSALRSRFVESEVFASHAAAYETIDIEFIVAAAKQGDLLARHVIATIGSIVGQTIAPAVALLNPDTVIITGVVSELAEIVVESVRKEIELRVIAITANALTITVDKYHHYSVSVGAATLILEDFFHLPMGR